MQSASSATGTMVVNSRNVHTNMCAFDADHPPQPTQLPKEWERAIGTKKFFVPQLWFQHKLGSKNAHSLNDQTVAYPPFHQHASKEPTGRIELIAQETTDTPSDSDGNINHQLSRISKQYGTIDRNHHPPLKDVSITPMLHVEPDEIAAVKEVNRMRSLMTKNTISPQNHTPHQKQQRDTNIQRTYRLWKGANQLSHQHCQY